MGDYITLVRGDDSNFVDDKLVVVKFNTDIDFTGFKAVFMLGPISIDYNDISSKTINIIISKAQSHSLAVGKHKGILKLIDNECRVRTVTSVIPFKVIDEVKNPTMYVDNSVIINIGMNEGDIISIEMQPLGLLVSEAEQYKKEFNEILSDTIDAASTAQTAAVNATASAERAERLVQSINSTYIHNQDEAAKVWHVEHNLDKYPSVSVVDSANTAIYADVTYLDRNRLDITFNYAFAGKAYCN